MLEAQSNRQVTIKDLASSRDPTHGQISRPDPCQIPRPHPLPSPRGKRRQCSRAPGGGSKTVPITVPDISSPKTYNINHKTFSWLHVSAYLNSKAKSNLNIFLFPPNLSLIMQKEKHVTNNAPRAISSQREADLMRPRGRLYSV